LFLTLDNFLPLDPDGIIFEDSTTYDLDLDRPCDDDKAPLDYTQWADDYSID
jgi:hypothetical protein